MTRTTLSASIASTLLILSTQASAQGFGPPPEPREPMSCGELAALSIANTTIDSAETVAAGAFRAPAPAGPGPGAGNYTSLPAFCRVTGSIMPSADSDIRFELWLPADNWNGRFMQTGNGGAAGSIVYASLVEPLMRGYAVANTDTGHQGGAGDFSWVAGHPEKLVDYQYRAPHELTVVGKYITSARYGTGPEKSYWVGCSTGGRQGLKEAQFFSSDYDAIVAGAPASNWTPLMGLSIEIQRNMGPGGLGADKLGLLKEAAIAQCDANDGVRDRVITNTASCDFDPASLQCGRGDSESCLLPTEVAAAKRIYAGLVDSDGEVLMPGTGPASESLWAAYASPQFSIGTSFFRNAVVHDPRWDPASFDPDRDVAMAMRADGGAADAMDPDLTRFFGRGGKLITYHGTADGLIPYRNSVNYYESVVDRLGEARTEESMRLYLVPGMDHCSGGEGAWDIDWLGAMERWVEDEQPPEALPAAHPAPPSTAPVPPGAPASTMPFTRVVCPYPEVPTYRGRGDETDAANFECRVPQARRGR